MGRRRSFILTAGAAGEAKGGQSLELVNHSGRGGRKGRPPRRPASLWIPSIGAGQVGPAALGYPGRRRGRSISRGVPETVPAELLQRYSLRRWGRTLETFFHIRERTRRRGAVKNAPLRANSVIYGGAAGARWRWRYPAQEEAEAAGAAYEDRSPCGGRSWRRSSRYATGDQDGWWRRYGDLGRPASHARTMQGDVGER